MSYYTALYTGIQNLHKSVQRQTDLSTNYSSARESSLLVDLHPLRVLLYPRYKSLLYQIALATRDSEDEVIQRCAAEDIDVVAFIVSISTQVHKSGKRKTQYIPVLGPPRGEKRSGS